VHPSNEINPFPCVQVSFTTKEFRELLALPNVRIKMNSEMIQSAMTSAHEDLLKDRPRKRLIEIMAKTATEENAKSQPLENDSKTLHLHFLKSPVELESEPVEGESGRMISGVKCELNQLVKNDKNVVATGTGQFESIKCSLLLKSIGYKSTPVEGLPFDDRKGIIPNDRGRVMENEVGFFLLYPPIFLIICILNLKLVGHFFRIK
jgi:adrenodoxin-NADP+ reductase